MEEEAPSASGILALHAVIPAFPIIHPRLPYHSLTSDACPASPSSPADVAGTSPLVFVEKSASDVRVLLRLRAAASSRLASFKGVPFSAAARRFELLPKELRRATRVTACRT